MFCNKNERNISILFSKTAKTDIATLEPREADIRASFSQFLDINNRQFESTAVSFSFFYSVT